VATEQPKPGFEDVFTVADYYDGPLTGVANFMGRPHFYERIRHKNGYSDQYRLTPVSSETLELAREDWEIWLRWESAFHSGKTARETHPALPSDRQRHNEIRAVLDETLSTDDQNCTIRTGHFEGLQDSNPPRTIVRWSESQRDALEESRSE
jgi:uncharacterized protein (DUF2235 family)